MGSDLQRRDDDGGRDRPAGASQRDHRAEHPELPGGARKEESTGGKPGPGRMMRRPPPRRKTGWHESCGNAGAVESMERQRQAFHSFHEPLGNLAKRRRDSHISTAPTTKADGKVENQKQVSHFPTATTSLIPKGSNIRAAYGIRPPPGGGRSAPPKTQTVIVRDRGK